MRAVAVNVEGDDLRAVEQVTRAAYDDDGLQPAQDHVGPVSGPLGAGGGFLGGGEGEHRSSGDATGLGPHDDDGTERVEDVRDGRVGVSVGRRAHGLVSALFNPQPMV
jgi:hypothetical protein